MVGHGRAPVAVTATPTHDRTSTANSDTRKLIEYVRATLPHRRTDDVRDKRSPHSPRPAQNAPEPGSIVRSVQGGPEQADGAAVEPVAYGSGTGVRCGAGLRPGWFHGLRSPVCPGATGHGGGGRQWESWWPLTQLRLPPRRDVRGSGGSLVSGGSSSGTCPYISLGRPVGGRSRRP